MLPCPIWPRGWLKALRYHHPELECQLQTPGCEGTAWSPNTMESAGGPLALERTSLQPPPSTGVKSIPPQQSSGSATQQISSPSKYYPPQNSVPSLLLFLMVGTCLSPSSLQSRQTQCHAEQRRIFAYPPPRGVLGEGGGVMCAASHCGLCPESPPKSLGMIWGSLGGSLLWTGATGSCSDVLGGGRVLGTPMLHDAPPIPPTLTCVCCQRQALQ